MISKQLKDEINRIKKQYSLDEDLKNKTKREYFKTNCNNYETKMIMFKTHGLNNDLYYLFENYSKVIRNFKNDLSKIFYKNLFAISFDEFKIIDCEYVKLVDKYRKNSNIEINSKNFQDCYREVKTKYKNMIDSNIKWNKNVDMISYLTKFYTKNLKQYLLDLQSKGKIKSHQLNILKLLTFDEKRIRKIIFKRRKRILKKCKKIIFKKLSFTNSGVINTYDNMITKYSQQILRYNNSLRKNNRLFNKNGILKGKDLKALKTNALLKVNLGIEKYDLPIRLSEKYHDEKLLDTIKRSLAGGSKSSNQVTNLIQIDEFKKEVIIKFVVFVEKQIIPDSCEKILGVDVNTKNNLFSCSNGKMFINNENLVKKIVETEKKLKNFKNEKFKNLEQKIRNDKNISKEKKYKLLNNIKEKRKFNKYEKMLALKNNRRKEYLRNYMTSKLCKYAKYKCYDSLVIEDLSFVFSKNYIKNKQYEINYNDLFAILHLRELKEIIPRIANREKYNLSVSITPAAYTSQMCSVCGSISKDNRKSQEIFFCKNCHHCENADINAAKNIRNRIIDKNNLEMLHEKVEGFENTYKPKKIKYKTIKLKLNNKNKFLTLAYKYFRKK